MAYALEPLIQILQLTDPTFIQDLKPNFDSLLAKSLHLRDLLRKVSQMTSRSELAKLESRIGKASQTAEDILEPFLKARVLSQYEGLAEPPHELSYLADVEEQLDSITVDLTKLIDSTKSKDVPPVREPVPVMKTRLVGFLDILENLRVLMCEEHHPGLRVIPLVGMGGSGKTTIAQDIFTKARKGEHFDISGWVTVSQRFDTRNTLLALLESLFKLTKDLEEENEERLGEIVYKTLFGKRYFIVVDDIWVTHAWDKLKKFFPKEQKGSRILLTTRQGEVAEHCKFLCSVQKMRFLDRDESYELISDRVFKKKECPKEFADTGRNISINCKGLPLAIVVISGILVASKQTLEFWQLIERSVRSTVMGDETVHFKEVLSLSYNYLPHYLKPCFMYIGAFPEDAAIRCSRIMYLWVAEGFLAPFETKNWEDIADTYIKALIERNLITARKYESTGKVVSIGIHDMLWNLCHEKAREEAFFWFEKVDHHKGVDDVRRVCVHPSSELRDKAERLTPARSFVCITYASSDLAGIFLTLELLRVLDAYSLVFYQFPTEVLKLVNLRYLAFSCYADLPASLARYQYLRNIFICRQPSFRTFILPTDVWGMTQLRHIKSKESFGWHLPTDEAKPTLLENLLTLSNIQMSGMTNDIFERFPNLRKLGLCCNDTMPHKTDLTLLEKLETLRCTTDWSVASHTFLFSLILTETLKKLTLFLCKIPKEFMNKVAELPNLEHLKLVKSDFLGPNDETTEAEWEIARPEWETIDDGFPKLISIVMDDLNLVCLKVDAAHFPALQRILIRDCCSLGEIPEDIGNIYTLELIDLDESSPLVVSSCRKIQAQQKELENTTLEFHFYSAA